MNSYFCSILRGMISFSVVLGKVLSAFGIIILKSFNNLGDSRSPFSHTLPQKATWVSFIHIYVEEESIWSLEIRILFMVLPPSSLIILGKLPHFLKARQIYPAAFTLGKIPFHTFSLRLNICQRSLVLHYFHAVLCHHI